MSKVIIGLFILLLFVLFILLSWIIVLTVALLIFPRKGKKEKLLHEKQGMA